MYMYTKRLKYVYITCKIILSIYKSYLCINYKIAPLYIAYKLQIIKSNKYANFTCF